MSDPITIPLYWPQQSPIDLKNAITAQLPTPTFDYRNPLVGEFEDHNLKIKSGIATLTYDGQTCPLKRLHLHTPAEHLVAGVRNEIELHLVHDLPQPRGGSLSIVVGIFLEEVTNKNVRTHSFFKDLAAAYSAAASAETSIDKKRAREFSFDPGGLKPKDKDFFRYEGALTTEDFEEVVSWIVYRQPLPVKKEYLDQIKANTAHDFRKIKQHARRFILKNF